MIKLFTIYDKQSKTTNHPFPMATNRDAIEGLRQVVEDKNTAIAKYPEDFDLYFLGDYNPRDKKFDLVEPELIKSASELIQ